MFLDDLTGWDGTLPVGLVRPAPTREIRREAFLAFARRAVGDPGAVVLHERDRPPRFAGAGPRLSSASRDGLAVFAAAKGPIGVDVERVDDDAEIPAGVLHPGERAALARTPRAERASAFAAIWACKEAYGKALGLGLSRDPGSFEVTLGPAEPAIRDPDRSVPVSVALAWRRRENGTFVLALVAPLG